MTLDKTERLWSELADLDPMWAVLSWPDKRNGRWDPTEFFASGTAEIAGVMEVADSLGLPSGHATAVDFGCGVGRLTRALAGRFDRCIGFDISPRMVELAGNFNDAVPGVEFRVNEGTLLATLADQSCDFVYSNRVLQHLPSDEYVRGYLAEFLRILAPGGLLCFGLPEPPGLRYRVAPSRILFPLLRKLRIPSGHVYRRVGMFPAPMLGARPARVKRWIECAGGSLVRQVAYDEGVILYFAKIAGSPSAPS